MPTCSAPLLRLGFGFVEVGTLTPLPQPGNPKPRMSRLVARPGGDQPAGVQQWRAGGGARAAAAARSRAWSGSISARTRTRPTGWRTMRRGGGGGGCRRLSHDQLSSPNTPGLRGLQAVERWRRWSRARARRGRRRPPLFVKIAPDLTRRDRRGRRAALARGVDGLIVAQHDDRAAGRDRRRERGRTFGRAAVRALDRGAARLRAATGGRIALVGVGGVDSGRDAYAKIRAGADAVQLYTGAGLWRAGADDADQARAGGVPCARRVRARGRRGGGGREPRASAERNAPPPNAGMFRIARPLALMIALPLLPRRIDPGTARCSNARAMRAPASTAARRWCAPPIRARRTRGPQMLRRAAMRPTRRWRRARADRGRAAIERASAAAASSSTTTRRPRARRRSTGARPPRRRPPTRFLKPDGTPMAARRGGPGRADRSACPARSRCWRRARALRQAAVGDAVRPRDPARARRL